MSFGAGRKNQLRSLVVQVQESKRERCSSSCWEEARQIRSGPDFEDMRILWDG